MLVPNQLVEVRVGVKTLKHYKSLGYDVKCFDVIMVPPEHLTTGSNVKVKVRCDICEEVILRPYEHYIEQHADGLDTCNKCKSIKSKKTCIEKYGVENPKQCEEIKQKGIETSLNRYGVEFPMQADVVQKKRKASTLNKYGVLYPAQSEKVRVKMKQTIYDKYGVEYASQSEEVKNKIRRTVKERYGVDYISQSEEIKEKKKNTLIDRYGVYNSFQIDSIPVSSQQMKLHKIIQSRYPSAELNYPHSTCSLDIFVEVKGVKIDIEYDGSYWHQDKQKDIKRDKFLQSQGFKTLRVRSGHLLPTEQELFDAIDYLVNTEHHFKEIILSDWKTKEDEECQKQLQVAQ